MIRYVLRCDDDHRFEAWFRSKTDCELLIVSGETTCPLCELSAMDSIPAEPQANHVTRTDRLASARLIRRPTQH